jgi:uncharacterized membrane protein
MTQDEIDRREWQDPRNWRGGWLGIYHSPRDSRVWVPKRNPAMGWTVNTARTAGLAWTAFFVGLVALAVALAVAFAARGS